MPKNHTNSIDEMIAYTERRIKHACTRLNEQKEKEKGVKNKTEELTYHAGWSAGYWEGKLDVLQNMLDDLKELKANHRQQQAEDNLDNLLNAEQAEADKQAQERE